MSQETMNMTVGYILVAQKDGSLPEKPEPELGFGPEEFDRDDDRENL